MVSSKVITNEEFDRIERAEQHEELLAALSKPAAVVLELDEVETALKEIAKKEFTGDVSELVAEIAGLREAIEAQPKSFKVERNEFGLIARIVAE